MSSSKYLLLSSILDNCLLYVLILGIFMFVQNLAGEISVPFPKYKEYKGTEEVKIVVQGELYDNGVDTVGSSGAETLQDLGTV